MTSEKVLCETVPPKRALGTTEGRCADHLPYPTKYDVERTSSVSTTKVIIRILDMMLFYFHIGRLSIPSRVLVPVKSTREDFLYIMFMSLRL